MNFVLSLVFVIIFSESYVYSNPLNGATNCLKPEEVKETGKGIGDRIDDLSWTNMKRYLREQRSKLNLTKTEQDNCQSEFMDGFREALGGADSWNYKFYKPTVTAWFGNEKDEAFKPYFRYGGYGY